MVAARWHALHLEDAALAGWNALGVPLVTLSALRPVVELGGQPNTLAGVIQLLAVVGVIVAIATRPTGAAPASANEPARTVLPYTIGPLIGGIASVAGSASTYLGVEIDGPAIALAGLALVAALALGDRLPVVDRNLRRVLVLPFIFVSAGVFNRFAADLLDGLRIATLGGRSLSADAGFALFLVGLLVGGLAVFYAALVAAPRQLADPEHGGGWAVRFVLYLLSAILGIGWLTAIVA